MGCALCSHRQHSDDQRPLIARRYASIKTTQRFSLDVDDRDPEVGRMALTSLHGTEIDAQTRIGH